MLQQNRDLLDLKFVAPSGRGHDAASVYLLEDFDAEYLVE